MKKQTSRQKQTAQEPQDIGKLDIPNQMIWMLKNAYEQTTIKRVRKELRHLEKYCNISNPEEVKLFVAKKNSLCLHKSNQKAFFKMKNTILFKHIMSKQKHLA